MKAIVNIDVPELGPAIAFYNAALGLSLRRTLDDSVAELVGAAFPIYLLAKPAGSGATHATSEERRYARHWTPVHIDFVVDDLAEAAKRARDAGAVQECECVEWRGSRCIGFADPFGHGFCLIEFAGDTYLCDNA